MRGCEGGALFQILILELCCLRSVVSARLLFVSSSLGNQIERPPYPLRSKKRAKLNRQTSL